MKITNRKLFMRYALPCIATLVKRGSVSQERADNLIDKVKNNKPIPRNSEIIFKTALVNCISIAKKMNKKSIDKEVIRRYFLVEHSRIVESRYKEKGDFDPIGCKTYVGDVIYPGKELATVETSMGKLRYRKEFEPALAMGDRVIVHNDFIVEKTNEDIEKLVNE
jgi:hypothetical protein